MNGQKKQVTNAVTSTQTSRGIKLNSMNNHSISLRSNALTLLELEDVLFSLNSAVMMPYAFPEDGSEFTGSEHLQGLDILYVLYKYIEQNPSKRLLIAGHTDTTGGPLYNLNLSDARAQGVYYLLMGNKIRWIDICLQWHRVSDIQRLLKYFCRIDPGPISDKMERSTREAITNWQKIYNITREGLGVPYEQKIPVDGIIGPKTWGAFFDLYMFSLAEMLGCGHEWKQRELLGMDPPPGLSNQEGPGAPYLWIENMNKWRDKFIFVDSLQPYLGCGESFPIEEEFRNNYRSKKNRRVEFLLFDPEDIPNLSRSKPVTGIYTFEECKFYDPRQYELKVLEDADSIFKHWVEFQTVNEQNHPVSNADLVISPLRGGKLTVKSDDQGLCNLKDLPPGRVFIELPDGNSAFISINGQLVPAVLKTYSDDFKDVFIANVIVKESLNEEERNERTIIRTVYNRSGPPKATAIPPSKKITIDKKIDKIISNKIYAHDNLALIAGLNDGRFNKEKLRRDLAIWLKEYYPIVSKYGFILFVLDNECLTCFNKSGKVAYIFKLRTGIEKRLKGSIGAYTDFVTPGDPLFRDMTSYRGVIGVELMDQEPYVPLKEIVVEDAIGDLSTFIDTNQNTIHILYRSPLGGQLVSLALQGGAGYLEDYDTEGKISAHERNKATIEFVAQVYKSELKRYIGKVNAIGSEKSKTTITTKVNKDYSYPMSNPYSPTPLIKSKSEIEREKKEKDKKAKEELLALKQLGPPPSIYLFARPNGISKEQWIELYELNNESDYYAWVIISDKINEIQSKRGEGEVFFRVKFKFKAKADLGAGPYGEVKVESTIDFGSDLKVFKKREFLATYGGKIGPLTNKLLPEKLINKTKYVPEIGYEQEVNLETKEKKSKVKTKILGYGLEISDDGKVKFVAPLGATTEFNNITKIAGMGVTIPTPWGELYLGLHFKGILEETIMAYLTRAPGFFERRVILEYFDIENPLLWNEMDHFEQANLMIIGWKNQESWDRRHLMPFDKFPDATRTALHILMEKDPKSFAAAVRLGMDREDWDRWKDIALKKKQAVKK